MKTKVMRLFIGVIFTTAIILMACAPSAASAAETADFYKGKTIKILLGFAPGNNVDLTARIIAPYLAKQTNATVVVQNVDGGAGLVARNSMFQTAKPDGLTIMLDPSGALWPSWVLEQEGVAYDISKFEYLGGLEGAMMCLTVSPKGPYQTIEALRKSTKPIKFAISGVASLPSIAILNTIDALGLNAIVGAGYKNSAACVTAMAQGEIEGTSGNLETAFRYQKEGLAKILLYQWYERNKNFSDVPSLNEFIKIPDKSMKLMKSIPNNGRIFFAPPGTPKDRVQYLQNSLTTIFANKEFQAAIVKVAEYWLGALTGEEIQQLAAEAAKSKSDSLGYYKSLVAKYVK
jgi:tripartite-type tricarboxylate transporter receptor subunit TctC